MFTALPDPADVARLTARMLLDIKAVHFRPAEPYTWSNGMRAPTYVDCRKLISYPRARSALMDWMAARICAEAGFEAFDSIAGGETAGIPFAALIAERLGLPMTYVRKAPKGHGRNARIEGVMAPGDRVLLVEDLATDGGSKLNFVQAIRDTGATCGHAAVIFYYDIFPETPARLSAEGLRLHHLCSWWDVLAEARRGSAFDAATLDAVEAFLSDPRGWRGPQGVPV